MYLGVYLKQEEERLSRITVFENLPDSRDMQVTY